MFRKSSYYADRYIIGLEKDKSNKKEIKANGIKQTFISEKARIPAPVLNLLLNDNRKIEVNEYIRICNAIGVPLEPFKLRMPDKTKKLLVCRH